MSESALDSRTRLRLVSATFAVRSRALVEQVSLDVKPGRVHVLLGPNGAGKSTVLKLLAGDLRPDSGSAELDGRPLSQWPALELARRRAVMVQREHLPFPFRAREVVALGRLPWQRSQQNADEHAIVSRSLQTAQVSHLADREYPSLSGGERARVQFARALAQIDAPDASSRYLLLDEPTASLDFAFLHDCLETLRTLAASGIGVLVILQDPDLALRYADDISLLLAGRVIAAGRPFEVLSPDSIARLYGIDPSRVLRLRSSVGEAPPDSGHRQ